MENFRPVKNTPPSSLIGKIIFFGRMVLDFQILTIFHDLKKTVPGFCGDVLDVGCGQSPYRFLLNPESTNYFGIDIVDADKFDYTNKEITPFNGREIPFQDEKFDFLICTEVLEHVYEFQVIINEMRRVLKYNGIGIITIPWSARYHYIPYDFFRYTRSSLEKMFSEFSSVQIKPRGSDIPVIANKLIILWMRNLFPKIWWKLVFVPFWLLFFPIPAFAVLTAHICLFLDWGSNDDPLGFTITVKK
jgi:SAM-dependent methyltransferase